MDYGRIAIIAQGTYDSQLAYEKLDFVEHNESSYIAKEDILIGEVPGVSNKWQLACKKGDTGDNGLSAYSDWLSRGNSGTFEQFLIALGSKKRVVRLMNDHTSPTNTPVLVNDLQLSMEQNKVYRVKFLGGATTLATTTGVALKPSLVSGGATINGYMEISATHAAASTGLRAGLVVVDTNIANSTALVGNGVGAIGVPVPLEMQAILTCTVSGIFGIYFYSKVASSAVTLKAGAFLEMEEI